MEKGFGGKKILSYMDSLLGLTGLITILIISVGVIFRFILKMSMAWSDEVLRTIFVWSYFIGTALLYKYQDLMRLELLDEWLKNSERKTLYKIVRVLQETIIFIFSSVISYYSVNIIKMQVMNNQVTTTSGSPAWIFTSGFAIGLILLMIFSVQKIYYVLKE